MRDSSQPSLQPLSKPSLQPSLPRSHRRSYHRNNCHRSHRSHRSHRLIAAIVTALVMSQPSLQPPSYRSNCHCSHRLIAAIAATVSSQQLSSQPSLQSSSQQSSQLSSLELAEKHEHTDKKFGKIRQELIDYFQFWSYPKIHLLLSVDYKFVLFVMGMFTCTGNFFVMQNFFRISSNHEFKSVVRVGPYI